MSSHPSQVDERARELMERVKSGIKGGAVVRAPADTAASPPHPPPRRLAVATAPLRASRRKDWQVRSRSTGPGRAVSRRSAVRAAGLTAGAAGSVGKAFVRGVAKRTAFTSAGFAVFMSLYSTSLFAIEQVNGGHRSPVSPHPHLCYCAASSRVLQVNSLAAGCVAGAAVALNTRNVPVIALSSALSGVLMLGVDVGWRAGEWVDGKRREMMDPQKKKHENGPETSSSR